MASVLRKYKKLQFSFLILLSENKKTQWKARGVNSTRKGENIFGMLEFLWDPALDCLVSYTLGWNLLHFPVSQWSFFWQRNTHREEMLEFPQELWTWPFRQLFQHDFRSLRLSPLSATKAMGKDSRTWIAGGFGKTFQQNLVWDRTETPFNSKH